MTVGSHHQDLQLVNALSAPANYKKAGGGYGATASSQSQADRSGSSQNLDRIVEDHRSASGGVPVSGPSAVVGHQNHLMMSPHNTHHLHHGGGLGSNI